jgi:Fic family protein
MNKFKWTINSEINQLIIELESAKLSIDSLPINQNQEKNLRQHSLLKSAVYSARIEGFPDTVNSPKKESQNLLKAYQYIFSHKSPQKLGNRFIKKVHKLVLNNLSSYGGNWRSEQWAIFNQSGAVVYLAPPHFEVPKLMEEYPKYINKLIDHPSVKAAVAQFVFEKIHPFADGNGRVGRLVSAFILEKNGFGFQGQAPFEEYIDNNRADYYYHLESSLDCTGFVKFFLESLVAQSKEYIKKLNSTQDNPDDSLLPRRREILEIIRDHPKCSFDFLKRRFLTINGKTLHYDLLRLQKAGFIRKLGATKGVVYMSINH